MLPPLPPKQVVYTQMPDDYRYRHKYAYTEQQMRAYGRAVAEACAAKCDAIAAAPSSLWEERGCWSHAAENCAAAIRAMPVED